MHYSCDYYPRKNKIISVQHRQQPFKQRQKANPSLYFIRYLTNIFPLATESWTGRTWQECEAWLPCSWPWRDEGGRDLSQDISTRCCMCATWTFYCCHILPPMKCSCATLKRALPSWGRTLAPFESKAHPGLCLCCPGPLPLLRDWTELSGYWYSVSPLDHFSAWDTASSSTTRR